MTSAEMSFEEAQFPEPESSFHLESITSPPQPSEQGHHDDSTADESESALSSAPALEHRPSAITFDSRHSLLDRLPSMSTLRSTSSTVTLTPSIMPPSIMAHSVAPDRRPASSAGEVGSQPLHFPRKALTLKEQNTKVDELTKENFDLKLKIHFLSEALQNRSEDGVKELIESNVQLRTDLANERKDGAGLRKKLREMERKLEQQEKALHDAQSNTFRDDEDNPTLQAQMHEEILYLRMKNDTLDEQVTTLREDIQSKEIEKRKMAEHMRGMAGQRGNETNAMKEMEDMWQDLLNAETARREHAEEENSKLRNELTAMRIEKASPAPNRTSDVRARTPKRRSQRPDSNGDGSDVEEDLANGARVVNGQVYQQLQHEADELRRNLAAQTSMLTSRNRERERMQQEVEDLKLMLRKGDGARSLAGESIFDRSVSRAQHQRPQSRGSNHTAITEAERDDWHKKEGELRDANAEHRLKYQDLHRQHNEIVTYVGELEHEYQIIEEDNIILKEDQQLLSQERDELMQALDEANINMASIREEAIEQLDKCDEENKRLEDMVNDYQRKLEKTQNKLHIQANNYEGLKGELTGVTARVIDLEDEKQHNIRTIETLEQNQADAEVELAKWDQKGIELDERIRKLEITEESLHSEISFLRGEQEGDKITIGEQQSALDTARQTIQDSEEKLCEIEEAMAEEHRQRDVLENKSKEELQKVLDDLNMESSKAKDEVRRLRRALSAKEIEASSEKQKLDQLEHNLRHILGDPQGTRSSLLADIEKLQREMETTANELDRAKMDTSDKDRLLRHRDGLLESTSLESRRLSDLLEKERSSRKHDLEQFEKASYGQATHMRTIAQKESRVLELETLYSQDKRKMAALEQQYRDQLHERNNLLLALWNRLSTLCGADWAQNHSLVNGEVPSADTIGKHLPAFNKNVISAVKTIEALIGSFKVRARSIEKDLWRDYQTLEHNLNMRVRRMESLEQAVLETQSRIEEDERAQAQAAAQTPRPGTSRTLSVKGGKGSEEIAKLKSEVKLLKAELKFHRQHPSAIAQQMLNQHIQTNPEHARQLSSSGSIGGSRSGQSPARQIVATLLRHHSTSAVEQMPVGEMHQQENASPRSSQQIVLPTPSSQPSEQRWVHRLKELERRLKAEREARLLDRQGARDRLKEAGQRNEELEHMLEREREAHMLRSAGPGSEIEERLSGHAEVD